MRKTGRARFDPIKAFLQWGVGSALGDLKSPGHPRSVCFFVFRITEQHQTLLQQHPPIAYHAFHSLHPGSSPVYPFGFSSTVGPRVG